MSKQKKEKIPGDVNWLIWAIAISWFFWGPADAYYSLFLQSFGASYSQIGWFISLSRIIPIMISIPFGILADKFSARRMIIISMIGYLLFPLLFFYSGYKLSIPALIGAILIASLFKIIRNIGMNTYIKEKTSKELSGRVWARFEGITSGLWGLGLVFGAFLVIFFQFYELFFLVVIGAIIALFIVLGISESNKVIPTEFKHTHNMPLFDRVRRGVHHIFTVDKRVSYMLLVTFIMGMTAGNLNVFMVLFAKEINFGLPTIGLLMGFIYSSFFAAIPLRRISTKIGKFGSMATGQFLMVVCMICVAIFSEQIWWVLFIAFFFHWFSYLLVKPVRNSIVAALTPRDLQGEVSGIQMFLLGLASFVGALLFGYVSDIFGLKYVFFITAALYLLMFLLFITLRFKYEHTVKGVVVHPHSSHLSMLHHDHLGKSSKKVRKS